MLFIYSSKMSKVIKVCVVVLVLLLSQVVQITPFFVSKLFSSLPSRSRLGPRSGLVTAPNGRSAVKHPPQRERRQPSASEIRNPTPTTATSNSNPTLKLSVNIPQLTTMHYEKELNVKVGGQFQMETPMENYQYSSKGNVQLRCVLIQYLMQSMYTPNLMCFYLHFLIFKQNDKGQPELCFWTLENDIEGAKIPRSPRY